MARIGAEVIKLPCSPRVSTPSVVASQTNVACLWDRKGQETVHQVRHDPALLERSLGAVVGNRSAICQLGPMASNGRSTGIDVLAPKKPPFVARTTTAYERARAPKGYGYRRTMSRRMEEGIK